MKTVKKWFAMDVVRRETEILKECWATQQVVHKI